MSFNQGKRGDNSDSGFRSNFPCYGILLLKIFNGVAKNSNLKVIC